jgi:TRAP-type mannitol/chloroaromatic compound transport system substrate-binding protein
VVSVASMTASAGPRVKWKMQSAFGSTLVHLGPGGLRFADRLKTMSEGKLKVKFFEPGALVPSL